MNSVWEIRVVTDATSYAVCGDERVLRMFMAEWEASMESKTNPVLVLQGICDTADRAEHTIMVKADTIQGCSLIRKY